MTSEQLGAVDDCECESYRRLIRRAVVRGLGARSVVPAFTVVSTLSPLPALLNTGVSTPVSPLRVAVGAVAVAVIVTVLQLLAAPLRQCDDAGDGVRRRDRDGAGKSGVGGGRRRLR